MSAYVCMYVLSSFHVILFEASHWPSGHMIKKSPLAAAAAAATAAGQGKKKA